MKTLKVQAKKSKDQFTVRGVSPELNRHLRAEATRQGWSLNRTVLELLTRAAGLTTGPAEHTDLDELFGVWSEGEALAFERNLERMRQVDEALWR